MSKKFSDQFFSSTEGSVQINSKIPIIELDSPPGGDFACISFIERPRVVDIKSFLLDYLVQTESSVCSKSEVLSGDSIEMRPLQIMSHAPSFAFRVIGSQKEPSIVPVVTKKSSFEDESLISKEISNNLVLQLIFKVLADEEIQPKHLEISELDKTVLSLVLRQKFGIRAEQWDGTNLLSTLNKLRSFPSKKRKEENRKFVFKRVSKVLRVQFCMQSNSKRKVNKQEIDEGFFRHYFEDLAKGTGQPLEEFYLPGSCTNKIGLNKTFTAAYIELIKRSAPFRADFARELKVFMDSNLKKMVESKVAKMLPKIEQLRKRVVEDGASSYGIIDKKGKLPWSIVEITTAFRCVLSSFSEQPASSDSSFVDGS